MATTTVVDQLIVKLGLDPRDFTKGEKEVASGVLRTKEVVRKGATDMSGSMEKAAKSFSNSGGVLAKVFSRGGAVGLAIALAIAAGKKINDMLYEVAENTRKLGVDAKNFNQSAAGLRNMQNAAEMAGGALEDATVSASTLGKSLFDLKFNGQISESLIQLARLGVQFTDASGKARDFKDVAMDSAEALQKAQASGQMSRADAYQFATQAGFSGGVANLVADGPGALRAALDKQEARRQVSQSDVDVATDRVQAYTSLSQAGAAVGVGAMAAESPMMTGLSKKSEAALTDGVAVLGEAVDKTSMALGDMVDKIKESGATLGNAIHAQGQWMRQKLYADDINKAADKYGIDRDVLSGIARVESGYDPSAEAKRNGVVTGRGIMQLNPKFFPNAGRNPRSDIDTAAQHFSSLLAGTEGTEAQRYTEALRMYNAGETNYRTGKNLGPENRAYAGKVLRGTGLEAFPTPGAQSGATTNNRGDVTFEQVTIQTRGGDGETIAADFVDSTKRKLNAAQAETGMN